MMRGLYFIEHNLVRAQAEALYQAIGDALLPAGLQPYESQADAGQPTSLMEACQRVYLDPGYLRLIGAQPGFVPGNRH